MMTLSPPQETVPIHFDSATMTLSNQQRHDGTPSASRVPTLSHSATMTPFTSRSAMPTNKRLTFRSSPGPLREGGASRLSCLSLFVVRHIGWGESGLWTRKPAEGDSTVESIQEPGKAGRRHRGKSKVSSLRKKYVERNKPGGSPEGREEEENAKRKRRKTNKEKRGGKAGGNRGKTSYILSSPNSDTRGT